MNREISNYSKERTTFIIICVGFAVCILKSFFGMARTPFYYLAGVKTVMSVICTIIEIAIIVLLSICMNNASQMAAQRNKYFYDEEEEEEENNEPEQQDQFSS